MNFDEHPSSTRWLYEGKKNPGIPGLKALAADTSQRRPLWAMLLISILMALSLPLVNVFFIYPAFTDVLVKSIEQDSERLAAYLVPPGLKFSEITSERLTARFYGDIYKLENDFGIVKIKIYSPEGVVLYSTDLYEVGDSATEDVFFGTVGRGRQHSVLVEAGDITEEGEVMQFDVVETYYPIMNGKRFLGAFELYYDVSEPMERLRTLRLYSTTIMTVLSVSLVVTVLVLMRKEAARQLAAERTEALKGDIDRITRHDLKSPFIGILSGLEYLEHFTQLNQEQMDMTSQMREAADTGLDMINKSLSLYKMEMGTYRYAPTDMDFLHTARRVRDNLTELALNFGTKIAITLEGRPVSEEDTLLFRAEEPLCYTLLANLIKNAIEASSEGETVKVDLQEFGGLRMTVRNRAVVPPEIRATFFEKYATAGKSSGTGLGTYSARLMVLTMGGTIDMTTDETSGTTITVNLPWPSEPEPPKEK